VIRSRALDLPCGRGHVADRARSKQSHHDTELGGWWDRALVYHPVGSENEARQRRLTGGRRPAAHGRVLGHLAGGQSGAGPTDVPGDGPESMSRNVRVCVLTWHQVASLLRAEHGEGLLPCRLPGAPQPLTHSCLGFSRPRSALVACSQAHRSDSAPCSSSWAMSASEPPKRCTRAVREREGASPRVRNAASSAASRTRIRPTAYGLEKQIQLTPLSCWQPGQ